MTVEKFPTKRKRCFYDVLFKCKFNFYNATIQNLELNYTLELSSSFSFSMQTKNVLTDKELIPLNTNVCNSSLKACFLTFFLTLTPISEILSSSLSLSLTTYPLSSKTENH